MSPTLEHDYYVADPLEFIREKLATLEFLMFMTPEAEKEWTYVVYKIKQLWFQNKKRVKLSELARRLGVEEGAMSTSAITMLGLGPGWQSQTPLPLPTVDGYGEA